MPQDMGTLLTLVHYAGQLQVVPKSWVLPLSDLTKLVQRGHPDFHPTIEIVS